MHSMAGAAAMSFDDKLIVVAIVCAVLVPMSVIVLRRIIRGQPFRKSGSLIMPPTGPSVDIDGGG